MAISVLEFSREGYKIRKVFGKNSTVVKWGYRIWRIGVMASCQKVPIYYVKNHLNLSEIFKSLYFLKWCPIFDSSPLLQISKFNNFIWLKLIFSQKPFWFCIPPLKTPQPVLPYYCVFSSRSQLLQFYTYKYTNKAHSSSLLHELFNLRQKCFHLSRDLKHWAF